MSFQGSTERMQGGCSSDCMLTADCSTHWWQRQKMLSHLVTTSSIQVVRWALAYSMISDTVWAPFERLVEVGRTGRLVPDGVCTATWCMEVNTFVYKSLLTEWDFRLNDYSFTITYETIHTSWPWIHHSQYHITDAVSYQHTAGIHPNRHQYVQVVTQLLITCSTFHQLHNTRTAPLPRPLTHLIIAFPINKSSQLIYDTNRSSGILFSYHTPN